MIKFSREEKYIYDESPEISVGENLWTQTAFKIFPAFRNRNYRIYFAGGLISLIGTWLQIVAQGWLVLQLTNSAFLVGVVTAAGTLPTLLFSLFGGVIVDRFSKRKILIVTQIFPMVLSFTMGVLTILGVIQVWHIMILAFLLGMVNAVDAPARQSFVIELVGRENLPSAIALNSAAFNGARVIGPGIAGFLIAIVGVGGAFLINAVSYIAVILALVFLRVNSVGRISDLHILKAIKEGLIYSFTHPVIRILLLFAGVASVFGWSHTTILSVIAQNTFHKGAEGLGYLFAASGLGSVIATIVVSAFAKNRNPLIFILGGTFMFSISILLFAATENFILALFFLSLSGFGMLSIFAMLNSTIQHLVEDRLRGRVMSIYALMFMGLFPLGNIEIGFLAEKFGTSFAISVNALVVLIFGVIVFLKRKEILKSYEEHRKL